MPRPSIFLSAAAIIGLGFFGIDQLEKAPAMAFLLASLTLGGGLLICGLFSLKMLWHGIIGAGALAFLGLCHSLMNLPEIAEFFLGKSSSGITPMLELATFVICAALLLRIKRAWAADRLARIISGE